jgi:hypothetical protein
LKLLFYNHALRRFDQNGEQRAKCNLVGLWADEAQRFMTASEDSTSDYNCVDVSAKQKQPSLPLRKAPFH